MLNTCGAVSGKVKLIEIRPLDLPEVIEILPKKFGDNRGFFSETYNRRAFANAGIDIDFVQDNHSYSAAKGTLRGLHYQAPPHAQDKLVRVTRGVIFDVAVDIRQGSPNFGKWVGLEVSAERWNQILVPKGFAHGFVTLTNDTEVLYKTSEFYAPECDRSIRYNDPEIAVGWPQGLEIKELSYKDANAPFFRDVEPEFKYQES